MLLAIFLSNLCFTFTKASSLAGTEVNVDNFVDTQNIHALSKREGTKKLYSWTWYTIGQDETCIHAESTKNSIVYRLIIDDDCDEDDSRDLLFVRFLPYDSTSYNVLNNLIDDNIPERDYEQEPELIDETTQVYIQATTRDKDSHLGCLSIEQSRPLSNIVIGDCRISRPIRSFVIEENEFIDDDIKEDHDATLYSIKGVLSNYTTDANGNIIDVKNINRRRDDYRQSKKIAMNGDKGYSERICFETTLDHKDVTLVESRVCYNETAYMQLSSFAQEELLLNQIFYFRKVSERFSKKLNRQIPEAQDYFYPFTPPDNNHFRLIAGQYEDCLAINSDEDEDDDDEYEEGSSYRLYSHLVTAECHYKNVLYFTENKEMHTLETIVDGTTRCLGVKNNKSAGKVYLMDCVDDDGNTSFDRETLLKLQWLPYGPDLQNQLFQNQFTLMCMDVTHSKRGGEVINYNCKNNTGYKPTNQLFAKSTMPPQ